MRIARVLAAVMPLTAVLAGMGVTAEANEQVPAGERVPAGEQVPAGERVLAALGRQELAWTECYPGKGTPQLKCAGVQVPADWSNPGLGTITIAVSRVTASDPAKRRGVLVTNPGGPGAPGLNLSLYLARAEKKVAAAYDIIGFDPRGVGSSSPVLECAPPSLLGTLTAVDGRDTSAANQRRFAVLDAQFARTCAATPLTRYITTDQIARDVDFIRRLLGESKISYVGYSAGTWLGTWYAALFPQRVDRFLLDGNLDFTSPAYASAVRQPRGFQRSFEKYLLPWIAAHHDVYRLGSTAKQVEQVYERRRAALARKPLTLVDGSRLTASGYDSAIAGGLYWTGSYDDLATALALLERYPTTTAAQKKVVLDVLGHSVAQGADAFWAVVCQDDASPSYRQVVADTDRFRTRYPLVGANWNVYPCPFWPGRPTGSPVKGHRLPKLLMINNDADPATPLAGAEAAREATPDAVLVTVRDQPDHTIYARGDACVEDVANRWLVDGDLPDGDVSCAGLPLPEPGRTGTGGQAVSSLSRPPAGAWIEQFSGAGAPHPMR